MTKNIRQKAILDIMRTGPVPSLVVLREELKKLDIAVSTSTISRDCGELNLLRSRQGYTLARNADDEIPCLSPDAASVLRRSVLKMDTAQYTLVIRTRPGSAQQVGLSLNNRYFDNILGAVAGHDTVVVVSKDSVKAQDVRDRISAVIS